MKINSRKEIGYVTGCPGQQEGSNHQGNEENQRDGDRVEMLKVLKSSHFFESFLSSLVIFGIPNFTLLSHLIPKKVMKRAESHTNAVVATFCQINSIGSVIDELPRII